MISSAYALGLLFIVLVAFIWAGSSVLTQYLYTNDSFDSPFLLTYIGVSLFTLWLPTNFVMEWMGQLLGKWPKSVVGRSENGGNVELGERTIYQSLPSNENGVDIIDDDDDNDDDDNNNKNNDEEQPQDEVQPPSQQPQHAANNNSSSSSNNNNCENTTTWTHADHRHAAMRIAPVWFMANWTYNASLAYTSITSSTVLASTGSLFTFLFAICTQDERFTLFKLYGVLLGVLGSCLTAWHDGATTTNDDSHQDRLTAAAAASAAVEDDKKNAALLWGDVLGLMSAVGYGAYAVQTRLMCPHDESRYSMQILLGYIGLFNMVALSPIALYTLLHNNQNDNNNNNNALTWIVFGFLVFKGLLDNVLSDYLWLRAVMLTSATVATVGLGLTIPLAVLSDIFYFQKKNVWNAASVGGALAVLTGFVLVNIGNDEEEHRNGEEQAQTGEDDDEEPRPVFQDYQDEVEE